MRNRVNKRLPKAVEDITNWMDELQKKGKHFRIRGMTFDELNAYQGIIHIFLNNRFLRERGMASNPKIEYQVFLCIFQKNSAMATLGLKEMGKFLWEGREKGPVGCLSLEKLN